MPVILFCLFYFVGDLYEISHEVKPVFLKELSCIRTPVSAFKVPSAPPSWMLTMASVPVTLQGPPFLAGLVLQIQSCGSVRAICRPNGTHPAAGIIARHR